MTASSPPPRQPSLVRPSRQRARSTARAAGSGRAHDAKAQRADRAALEAAPPRADRPIRLVRQTTAPECGLACLAMLLGAQGAAVSLADLRDRHGPMLLGMTVSDFVRMAAAEGLATRAVQFNKAGLRGVRLPAMLHWDLAHFVVLAAIDGDRYRILDPAVGDQWVSRRDVAEHFTGVAVEAWPEASFERLHGRPEPTDPAGRGGRSVQRGRAGRSDRERRKARTGRPSADGAGAGLALAVPIALALLGAALLAASVVGWVLPG